MSPGAEAGDWRALEAHPIAALIPLIGRNDLDGIVESMQKVGFLPGHPIILYEGKMLDGRSRHAAAIRAGVVPVFQEFSGDDPLAYVFSANVTRRHLNTSQKAFAIAGLSEYYVRHFKGPRFRKFSEFLAEKSNISARSIERAIQIRKRGSERLKEAVVAGEIKLGRAEMIAQMRSDEQDRLLAQGSSGGPGDPGRARMDGPSDPGPEGGFPEVPASACDALIALAPFGDEGGAVPGGGEGFVREWVQRWKGCGATWVVFGWRNGADMPAVLGALVEGLKVGYVFEHAVIWDFSHPNNGFHSTGLRASFQPAFVFRAKGDEAKVAPMPKDLRRLTLLPDQDVFQYPLDEAVYEGRQAAANPYMPLGHPTAEVVKFFVSPFTGPGRRVIACWTPQGLLSEAGKNLGGELVGV